MNEEILRASRWIDGTQGACDPLVADDLRDIARRLRVGPWLLPDLEKEAHTVAVRAEHQADRIDAFVELTEIRQALRACRNPKMKRKLRALVADIQKHWDPPLTREQLGDGHVLRAYQSKHLARLSRRMRENQKRSRLRAS